MIRFTSFSGRKRPDFFCLSVLAALAVSCAAPLHAQNNADIAAPQAGQAQALPSISLRVGERLITAEIAADNATRAKGLMFRQALAPDHGMLFVFAEAQALCFWMKNTPLPLTIAFIDSTGAIINLADMQPQSLDTHCSLAPALYALEMEQGWFARHGIRPGARVQGLPVLRKRALP